MITEGFWSNLKIIKEIRADGACVPKKLSGIFTLFLRIILEIK